MKICANYRKKYFRIRNESGIIIHVVVMSTVELANRESEDLTACNPVLNSGKKKTARQQRQNTEKYTAQGQAL